MFAAGWVLSLIERGKAAWARLDPVLRAPLSIDDHGTRDAPPTARCGSSDVTFALSGGSTGAGACARRRRSRCRPAARSASSGRPAPASRRCCICCCATTRRDRARSAGATCRIADYTLAACAARSRGCRRSRSCSRRRSPRTSRSRAPTATRDEIEHAARMADLHADIQRFAARLRHAGRRARRHAVGRAAAARGDRARAAGRCAAAAARRCAVAPSTPAPRRASSRTCAQARARTAAPIIVSHRLSAVADADQIVVLQATGASSSAAPTTRCSRATAGMRRSGATSSSRRASECGMSARSIATTMRRQARTRAARRAAERRHALRAAVARRACPTAREAACARPLLARASPGLLEAAGPLFGKHFIDDYLLPRDARLCRRWRCCSPACLACRLARDAHPLLPAGAARRAGDALGAAAARERLRPRAALPMSFFDRAITGQLVSRITNDTESVKQLYTQVLFEMLVGRDRAVRRRRRDAVARLAPDADRAAAGAGHGRRSSGATSGCRRPPVTRSRELRSDINAQMAEGIAGMSVLQAAGAVGPLRRALRAHQRRALRGAHRRGARQRVAAAARRSTSSTSC